MNKKTFHAYHFDPETDTRVWTEFEQPYPYEEWLKQDMAEFSPNDFYGLISFYGDYSDKICDEAMRRAEAYEHWYLKERVPGNKPHFFDHIFDGMDYDKLEKYIFDHIALEGLSVEERVFYHSVISSFFEEPSYWVSNTIAMNCAPGSDLGSALFRQDFDGQKLRKLFDQYNVNSFLVTTPNTGLMEQEITELLRTGFKLLKTEKGFNTTTMFVRPDVKPDDEWQVRILNPCLYPQTIIARDYNEMYEEYKESLKYSYGDRPKPAERKIDPEDDLPF